MELLRGIMHGRTIELESAPGLPDGQPVTVVVRPEGKELPNASLSRAFGAWAGDAEQLDEFLEWNRAQRKAGRTEIGP